MECDVFDVGCQLGWLIDEFKLLFVWIYNGLLSGLAAVFEAIPAPSFLLNVSSYSLPDSVLYFTTLFQMPAGVAIMVSAYSARFILRRIPGIG